LPDTQAILLTAAGLIGLIGFIKLEMKLKYPVFSINLFTSNRLFAFSNLAALINYATTFAITFLLSLYLQYVLGKTPRDAGMILITQPVFMALVASISGKLSDTHDPRNLALVGIGFGMFSSPNTNAIMGSVNKKYLGIASATVGTMRLTGQMMSMAIATLILQVFIGNRAITAQVSSEFMNSMRITFIVFIVLCVIGVFASLARDKSGIVSGSS